MTDAADAEPERAKRGLGALDHAKLFVGDFGMIRNARRQTRGCGLVPGRQPEPARQLTNLLFLEVRFVERTADAKLTRGLAPRAVIAAIVGVAAVHDDGAPIGREARQL